MPHENNPFFSIIVPAYNIEKYILECINSVMGQSFQDFELILVDDGSTDCTGEICDNYQKSRDQHDKNQPHLTIVSQNSKKVNSNSTRPTIVVLHQPNQGLSVARNTGVEHASGKYLLFLDGDDFLEPEALQIIHDGLEADLDLLRFQAQEVFENGEVVQFPEPGFADMPGVEAFRKLSHYHYTENAWLYAYRRKFFMDHNFQYAPGCLAEDFGLTPLVIASAKKVKSLPDICYNYRQRDGSIMHGTASTLRRTVDIEKQLKQNIPKIAKIPDSASVLHFLVTSFLTSATMLNHSDFLEFYQKAKTSGWLQYVYPGSPKAWPRAFLLRHFPSVFYKIYRRNGANSLTS